MHGLYEFFPDADRSNPAKAAGTLTSRGSYLGIQTGYTFTKVRKRLKKLDR
ncbi:MAG: hypothetical protein HC880_18390 [Bacteroidia bacterium]|nr:hypothetical protein [Bacteroidia bacterium]